MKYPHWGLLWSISLTIFTGNPNSKKQLFCCNFICDNNTATDFCTWHCHVQSSVAMTEFNFRWKQNKFCINLEFGWKPIGETGSWFGRETRHLESAAIPANLNDRFISGCIASLVDVILLHYVLKIKRSWCFFALVLEDIKFKMHNGMKCCVYFYMDDDMWFFTYIFKRLGVPLRHISASCYRENNT